MEMNLYPNKIFIVGIGKTGESVTRHMRRIDLKGVELHDYSRYSNGGQLIKIDNLLKEIDDGDMVILMGELNPKSSSAISATAITQKARTERRDVYTMAIMTGYSDDEDGSAEKNTEHIATQMKMGVDTIIVTDNNLDNRDMINELNNERTKIAEHVLMQSVMAIVGPLTEIAVIGLQTSDISEFYKDNAKPAIYNGFGTGDDKTEEAVKMTLKSAEGDDFKDIEKCILVISGDVTLTDASLACDFISRRIGDNINITLSAIYNERLKNSCMVSLLV